jgi:hypothetical protein
MGIGAGILLRARAININELVSLLQCLLQIKLYLQPLFDAQYILFFTTIIQTVFIGFGINGFFELNLFGS